MEIRGRLFHSSIFDPQFVPIVPFCESHAMPSPFIPDGYTRCGSIEEGEFHSPVRFEYRPMLALDRARFLARIRRLAPDGDEGIAAVEQITVQELSQRLVSWTHVDETGEPTIISDQHLMRIEPHLLASLASVVLGLSAEEREDEATDEKNCDAGCGCCSLHPALPPAIVAIVCCTSTTNKPAAGSCTPGDRSHGRPARAPRADWRTSVVRKERPKNCTPSIPKTNRLTASIASAGRWDCSPMIPLSGGTRS
jgi:hypothetical protein